MMFRHGTRLLAMAMAVALAAGLTNCSLTSNVQPGARPCQTLPAHGRQVAIVHNPSVSVRRKCGWQQAQSLEPEVILRLSRLRLSIARISWAYKMA
jgi:hypothetical protein